MEKQSGDLETDSGNITDSMTLATKTRDQHFVVVIAVGQATITGDKGCDFLSILAQKNANALTNGRVWLFGLNTHLHKTKTEMSNLWADVQKQTNNRHLLFQ